jgi:hypothetical protein
LGFGAANALGSERTNRSRNSRRARVVLMEPVITRAWRGVPGKSFPVKGPRGQTDQSIASKEGTMSKKENTVTKKSAKEETVEVLYQKMGDRWFAFSMVDDEVFIGSISQEEINGENAARAGANQKMYKITGNS